MTKEEFADIMIKELKTWGTFIDLFDELPWQHISDDEILDIIDFVKEN